jgi:hypothetical protein
MISCIICPFLGHFNHGNIRSHTKRRTNIKDEHSVLIVAVPDTKTGIKRTFTVTNPEFVRLYRKYAALVPCTHPELKKYYKLCSVVFET